MAEKKKGYFKPLAVLDPNDWIPIFERLNAKEKSSRKLNWYTLILEGRLECPISKEVITELRYDINTKGKTYHFNFYSDKGNLMTIDHIKPISKGGDLVGSHNVQPMTIKHNEKKGSNEEYLG